jgi:hypothetical protein
MSYTPWFTTDIKIQFVAQREQFVYREIIVVYSNNLKTRKYFVLEKYKFRVKW